jgi:MFS family permease
MGRTRRKTEPKPAVVKLSRPEFFALLRNPVLLLLIGGMVLVNLPQAFAQSQLKLIALDNGVSDGSATAMVSLYAVGVIIGRFLTGIALDAKVRPHVVAIVALGLPAIGYGLFASGTPVAAILMGGVLLVGLAQGAESDIGAYLISRRFDLKNFSLLLSFLTMSIGIGSALGSLVLSYTLYLTDSYTPFLVLAAVGTLAGAAAFWLTGARRWNADKPREAEDTVLEQAIAGELS